MTTLGLKLDWRKADVNEDQPIEDVHELLVVKRSAVLGLYLECIIEVQGLENFRNKVKGMYFLSRIILMGPQAEKRDNKER